MLCERFDIFNAKTSRFIFKAILSVLQALLFCIHGWIFVGVRLSGKRKKASSQNVESDEFRVLPHDRLFTAQQTNENHTPNTSLVNSSFSSIKRLTHPKLNISILFTTKIIHSHTVLHDTSTHISLFSFIS